MVARAQAVSELASNKRRTLRRTLTPAAAQAASACPHTGGATAQCWGTHSFTPPSLGIATGHQLATLGFCVSACSSVNTHHALPFPHSGHTRAGLVGEDGRRGRGTCTPACAQAHRLLGVLQTASGVPNPRGRPDPFSASYLAHNHGEALEEMCQGGTALAWRLTRQLWRVGGGSPMVCLGCIYLIVCVGGETRRGKAEAEVGGGSPGLGLSFRACVWTSCAAFCQVSMTSPLASRGRSR